MKVSAQSHSTKSRPIRVDCTTDGQRSSRWNCSVLLTSEDEVACDGRLIKAWKTCHFLQGHVGHLVQLETSW